MGEPSVEHRYYPAKFEYYDIRVYERDPKTNEFVASHTWVNKGWYEPDVYLDDNRFYVIWATTKSSDTKFRVFSNYQMQNGPDDRLRRAGTYTARVKFKVYKLSYTKESGMVFTPNHDLLYYDAEGMNAVADDHKQVNFLKSHQWVMEGPNAYGWVKRKWGRETDVVVSIDELHTIPPSIPVGATEVMVKVVNKVEEEYGDLDEE